LVIEDLISTGGSSLTAVEAIRKHGGEVVGVLAIFSYGFEDTLKAFEQANCQLQALSNYETLLRVAVSQGFITEADFIALDEWKITPDQWKPQVLV
jgi:orotate phosphoribosyltransferase